ncbi:hypothetical protein [Thioalkalivibrio thiocyanoxidans]|uniref:hypothetical protein n=1 Tax=Thioalkalivibrio thiocyanoxidans TaxID=152475 RepID=UPI0003726B3C|nr:hypothetical protein [Thioalkalivibrio thiocyanoxidans]
MPIKTRQFKPQPDPRDLTPTGPAAQYLTKNRGRPSERPKAETLERVKVSRSARKVVRRSILNKLSPNNLRPDDVDAAQSWLNLEEVGAVLGLSAQEVAARHSRGEPPKFEMRRNDQGHTELLCSLDDLCLHLIDEATR